MDDVGKALCVLVTVYDITFTDIGSGCFSVSHATAHLLTAGSHGAHPLSRFIYKYLHFVIHRLATHKPGFNVGQYTSLNRNYRKVGRNLAYRISVKPPV